MWGEEPVTSPDAVGEFAAVQVAPRRPASESVWALEQSVVAVGASPSGGMNMMPSMRPSSLRHLTAKPGLSSSFSGRGEDITAHFRTHQEFLLTHSLCACASGA